MKWKGKWRVWRCDWCRCRKRFKIIEFVDQTIFQCNKGHVYSTAEWEAEDGK